MSHIITSSFNSISEPLSNLITGSGYYALSSYVFNISTPLTAAVYSVSSYVISHMSQAFFNYVFTSEANNDSRLLIGTINWMLPIIGGIALTAKITKVSLSLMEVLYLNLASIVVGFFAGIAIAIIIPRYHAPTPAIQPQRT
jgi:hypothetical protein